MSEGFVQIKVSAQGGGVLCCEQKAAGQRIWREVLTGEPHKSLAQLLDSDKPIQLYLLLLLFSLMPACLFMHIQWISHLFSPLFGQPSHSLLLPSSFLVFYLFCCPPAVFVQPPPSSPPLFLTPYDSPPVGLVFSRPGQAQSLPKTIFSFLCLLN